MKRYIMVMGNGDLIPDYEFEEYDELELERYDDRKKFEFDDFPVLCQTSFCANNGVVLELNPNGNILEQSHDFLITPYLEEEIHTGLTSQEIELLKLLIHYGATQDWLGSTIKREIGHHSDDWDLANMINKYDSSIKILEDNTVLLLNTDTDEFQVFKQFLNYCEFPTKYTKHKPVTELRDAIMKDLKIDRLSFKESVDNIYDMVRGL